MKTSGILVISLGLTVLSSASSLGQGQVFRRVLILNTSVQQELQMPEEEVKRVEVVAREMLRRESEESKKLLAIPEGPDRRKKIQELRQTLDTDFQNNIEAVLTSEQNKRFEQIVLQRLEGTKAFANPRVQDALKLSKGQQAKIDEISAELRKQLREVIAAAPKGPLGGEDVKKYVGLAERAKEKAIGVLTDEQKTAWNQLIGKPFDFEVKF